MRHNAGKELLTPMEEAEVEKPSADHGPRFGFDARIRKCGYVIKSRPERGEPIWSKNGVLFTHSDVLLREEIE